MRPFVLSKEGRVGLADFLLDHHQRLEVEIAAQEWLSFRGGFVDLVYVTVDKMYARFLVLAARDRNAVILTFAAAVLGLAFAIGDPNIGALKRIGRVGIDLLLIAGVVEYLRKEPRERTKKSTWGEWLWLRKATRFGFVVGALLSIGICLWVPNIDVWLKGYRISLALVILGFGLTGTRKIAPGRNFAAAMALTILFEMVELGVLAYTAATVEAPIAYAGAHAVSLSVIRDLKSVGLKANQQNGKWLEATLLFSYDGKVVHTTPLANDLLRTANNDPLGSMMASAVYEWNQPPKIIFRDTFTKGQEQHCRFMRGINMPLDGYVTKDVRRFVRFTVEGCARNTHEAYWVSRLPQAKMLAVKKI